MSMSGRIPTLVRKFPNCSSQGVCRAFVRDLQIFLSQSYRPQKIILDLSSVSIMNAVGIDVLLKCMEEVAASDGELKLAAPSPETRVVLGLTQINRVVEVFATVEEAVASTETLPLFSSSSGDGAPVRGGNGVDVCGPLSAETEGKRPWAA